MGTRSERDDGRSMLADKAEQASLLIDRRSTLFRLEESVCVRSERTPWKDWVYCTVCETRLLTTDSSIDVLAPHIALAVNEPLHESRRLYFRWLEELGLRRPSLRSIRTLCTLRGYVISLVESLHRNECHLQAWIRPVSLAGI